MKFITHNSFTEEDHRNIWDRFFLGYLTSEYALLEEIFGEPMTFPKGRPITFQWLIKFEDGSMASIYSNGDNKRSISQWKIGGIDISVVARIYKIVLLGDA